MLRIIDNLPAITVTVVQSSNNHCTIHLTQNPNKMFHNFNKLQTFWNLKIKLNRNGFENRNFPDAANYLIAWRSVKLCNYLAPHYDNTCSKRFVKNDTLQRMIRFSVLSGQTCCCAGDSLVKKVWRLGSGILKIYSAGEKKH